jgi:DNA helicase IV
MDPLWLVLGFAVALVIALTTLVFIPFYRRLGSKYASDSLAEARTILTKIESSTKPHLSSRQFVPERISRPLRSEINTFVERTLPTVEANVRHTHDPTIRKEFDSISLAAKQLRQSFTSQNYQYTRQAITEHSKLLVDELNLDSAQQEATVRDDERNLVVAAAGSGKTRTLIARVRYLLERGVVPTNILAVTFTNKATEEMDDRLKRMGVPVAEETSEGVTVSTLHSLGKRIVQRTMSEPISVAEENWTDSLVAAALRDARESRNRQFTSLYFNAILNFHRNVNERSPTQEADTTYRTLRGEHVRSIGERIIADFLFTHKIPYKYEAKASWAQTGPGRDAYHPDFTLPDTDASIEYWGVDRAGNVPAYWTTTSAQYHQGMVWKREEFRRAGKKLIEFCDFERTEGTLERALEERLTSAGEHPRLLTLTELEKVHGDTRYVGSAIEQLLVGFIKNARSLRITPEEISRRLSSATPRVQHFGVLALAVLQRYERELVVEGRIDFSDMLHRASDILEKNPNSAPKFGHILVDEFQDMSSAMARFVNALIGSSDAHLFAVGDDWQAIYGFAGGDVDHVVNFESHFGPATHSILNVNYRSPALIVEAGSALIARNAKQIPKQIVISSKEPGEAFVHEVPDDDFAIVGETIRLVKDESQREKMDDILVLSRTNQLLDKVRDVCQLNKIPVANPDHGVSGLRVLSAHKAKGLEAKVVIIANASDHRYGFPSQVENPDVLEPVRMSPGNDEAEERRLFYVAVTRAMKRIHLIVRLGLPSPYIAEIEGSGTRSATGNFRQIAPGIRFSDTFFVDTVYPLTEGQRKSRIRQRGLLTTDTGRYGFTSWVPVYLEQGRTYLLKGVLSQPPYRNQPELKLDENTIIERFHASAVIQSQGVRQLQPRPPPAYQPRPLATAKT